MSGPSQPKAEPARPLARLGFLGLGWIGLNRLRAIRCRPDVEVTAVADPSPAAREAALVESPGAISAGGLDALLDEPIHGLVIATPSGQHFDQVKAAISRGIPVFCQKPLTRTLQEADQLISLARSRNVLLAVDYSYRHLSGMSQLRSLVQSGQLGSLFAIDLVFHNAYGPDKSWALDARQSGGGCVIDLATHLIDLALWVTGDREIAGLTSRLFHGGRLIRAASEEIEDAAFAQWLQGGRTHVQLACSWNASLGQEADIRAAFSGSKGSVVLRNEAGSFYNFSVEHCRGTAKEVLSVSPDDWGGRALHRWIDRLLIDPTYDAGIQRCLQVASAIDAVYGR